MATVDEVLNGFVNGDVLRAMNVRTSFRKRGERKLAPLGVGNVTVLFSYDEPIAVRLVEGSGVVAMYVTSHKYTRTTARHVNGLLAVIARMGKQMQHTSRDVLRAEAGLDVSAAMEKLHYGQRRGSRAPGSDKDLDAVVREALDRDPVHKILEDLAKEGEPRTGQAMPVPKPPTRHKRTRTARPRTHTAPLQRVEGDALEHVLPKADIVADSDNVDEFLTDLDDLGGADVLIVSRSAAYAVTPDGGIVCCTGLSLGPAKAARQVLTHLGFPITDTAIDTLEAGVGDIVVLSANGEVEHYERRS